MNTEQDTQNTTSGLDDDLFNAAFDEAVKSIDSSSSNIDEPPSTTVEEPSTELEVVVPTSDPTIAVPDTNTAQAPALVDIKALAAEMVAATRPQTTSQIAEDVSTAPTKEELEAEEQFKKDWPEHAAREFKLKQELDEVKRVFAETLESLRSQINPLADTVQATVQERHIQTITTAHPDALNIVPKVKEWIATQPKIYQNEMTRVVSSGTADEVVELLNIYKGATQKAVKPTTQTVDKEARLKRMEAPAVARSAATAEPDPDDFDSAFDAAMKKYDK